MKKTNKQVFLKLMELVTPKAELFEPITPDHTENETGRAPFSLQTMLCVHFMQQWFSLSDPAMEEAFFDVPLYRDFAQLESFARLPDESTILRFRHRLKEHKLGEQILSGVNELLATKGLLLKVGTAVDATLIPAPTSTKNKDKARDPEMHSSKKGNQWHFGMKAHIGIDAESGLVHTVKGTSGYVHDIIEANSLLHGVDQAEKFKAGVMAKVEHPFRVIKRQFGYLKTRYRGLKKNTAQLVTLFALSNLWMARWRSTRVQAVHLQTAKAPGSGPISRIYLNGPHQHIPKWLKQTLPRRITPPLE